MTWENNGEKICRGHLFLDYNSVTQRSLAKSMARAEGDKPEKGEASRPECTLTTDSVHVPGLIVVEEYLTRAQDEILMAFLTGPQAPWAPDQSNKSQTGAVKRLIQHYGYVFDYKNVDVLRDRQQPLPSHASGAKSNDNGQSCREWSGMLDGTRRTCMTK